MQTTAYSSRDGDVYASKVLNRPITTFPKDELGIAVQGRRVLITGAGGFIGSGLARLVATLEPASVTLVDCSEHALYEIDRCFEENWPTLPRRSEYCDIRDRLAVNQLFASSRPEVVFNAAALKHVPLLQAHAREAALTNALAVRTIASAACSNGVRAVISVSTDKAVNSASTMGRSKRLAERYLCALDAEAEQTRFASVRFGNVFGSTGSVVPLFDRQIRQGGPLTITDRRMTRYFMTVSEAAGFLLVAAGMLERPATPTSPLYILDMGHPIRILDVADRMISLADVPVDSIAVEEIGRRLGEKLFEELTSEYETLVSSGRDGVSLMEGRIEDFGEISTLFDALQLACDAGDLSLIDHLLHGQLVPGEEHTRDNRVIAGLRG